MNNILDLDSRLKFREWLVNNSNIEKECYIRVKRGKPVDSNIFYYLDALEEALCFGWIDSTVRVINGEVYQRFSKRVKNSKWSELNKERVRRLIKLNLMTKDGYKTLLDLNEPYVIDEGILKELEKNGILSIFMSFPKLYQRIRLYNVLFYKSINKEKYEKALKHLIEETKKNKMYGEWNDYGRLLDY